MSWWRPNKPEPEKPKEHRDHNWISIEEKINGKYAVVGHQCSRCKRLAKDTEGLFRCDGGDD